MRKLLITVSIVALVLTGCMSGKKDIIETVSDAISAPIILNDEFVTVTKSAPLIEASIVIVKNIDTPRTSDSTIAVITVPSYTIPPSTTPTFVPATTIYVSKPHKSLADKVLSTKNSKKGDVEVIADKNVLVEVPEITPWWYWFIGMVLSLIALYVLIQKYLGLIAKPIEWITRIFSWLH